MSENYFITESIRKASSLKRYSVRARKDTCLHDDLEYFMAHRHLSVSQLVDNLLNNDFVLTRYTDPEYPA